MNETLLRSELHNISNIEQRSWAYKPDATTPWDISAVAVAVHPSGALTLMPLLNELVQRGSGGILITGDSATDIVQSHAFDTQPDVNRGLSDRSGHIFAENVTNLFLVSASGGPEMELETALALKAVKHKHEFGNTVICCIEHDTGTLKENLTALSNHGTDLAHDIDKYFTADRSSHAAYSEKTFANIAPEKFVTTGPSMWDTLHTEDTEREAQSMREYYGLTNNDLVAVHYAARGHGLWSEMELDTTPALFQAIKNVASENPHEHIVLLYRFHPGDSQPNILNELIAKSVQSGLPSNLKLLVSQPAQAVEVEGRLVSAMADVTTSAYSTMLTGVALRGARRQTYDRTGQMPVYYLSPEVRQQIALSNYDVPAAVQEGAALSATTPQELTATLENAFFNKPERERVFYHQARELRDRYRFKGSATAKDRIFLQIRKLLRDIKNK